MAIIMVVEDDVNIHQMIKEYLEKEKYTIISAYSGTEALLQLQQSKVDLILMDLMLPGLAGNEVLEKIRIDSKVPIIVVSAKDSIKDKVDLLHLGADDYLTKPFALEELLARIEVQLRKNYNLDNTNLSYQNISLLQDQKTMVVDKQEIHLTKHEYKIMELLLKYPNRAFSKKEIYEYAWQDLYAGDDKTISVHISNIRNKCNNSNLIETVWGIGFKLGKVNL